MLLSVNITSVNAYSRMGKARNMPHSAIKQLKKGIVLSKN